MAKRKRKSGGVAKRRRTRSLSAAPKKRRRGLSSGGGGAKTKMIAGAKATLGAMVGGGVGVALNKMMPASTSKLMRLGIILAVGIAGNYMGAQNMSAGLVGSLTANTFPNGLLNDAEFADDDVLNDDRPLFLDDDGNPMVLDEGGYRYLNEDEIELLDREGAWDNYTDVT